MAQATQLLTAEEFWEMPEPLDHRLELGAGRLSRWRLRAEITTSSWT